MPFPHEHACRIRNPNRFQPDSFRRVHQESDGKPIDLIIGKLKGETDTTLQAFRYSDKSWSAKDARAHCTAHKGILFEPATGEEKKSMDKEQRKLTYPGGEIRAHENGDSELPKLIGHAAVFNKRSAPLFGRFFEVIAPGAFTESINRKDDVRALVEHEGGLTTLGRTSAGTLMLSEDDVGLRAEITPPNTQAGRDTVALVRRGDLSQMSFGFRIVDSRFDTVSGDDVRTIKKVDLFDISIVSFPAYQQTTIEVARRDYENWRKELEALERALLEKANRLKALSLEMK